MSCLVPDTDIGATHAKEVAQGPLYDCNIQSLLIDLDLLLIAVVCNAAKPAARRLERHPWDQAFGRLSACEFVPEMQISRRTVMDIDGLCAFFGVWLDELPGFTNLHKFFFSSFARPSC